MSKLLTLSSELRGNGKDRAKQRHWRRRVRFLNKEIDMVVFRGILCCIMATEN